MTSDAQVIFEIALHVQPILFGWRDPVGVPQERDSRHGKGLLISGDMERVDLGLTGAFLHLSLGVAFRPGLCKSKTNFEGE